MNDNISGGENFQLVYTVENVYDTLSIYHATDGERIGGNGLTVSILQNDGAKYDLRAIGGFTSNGEGTIIGTIFILGGINALDDQILKRSGAVHGDETVVKGLGLDGLVSILVNRGY